MRALALLVVVSLSSSAIGQQTVDQYRILYDIKTREMNAQADFNVAKKITLNPNDVGPDSRKSQPECLMPSNLKEDEVGYLSYWKFHVLSVVDDKNVLLRLNADTTLWLEDYPTKDLTDDQVVYVIGPVKIGPVKKYGAVSGSSRQVRSFKLIKEADQKVAEAEMHAKKCQPFGLKDGTRLQAIFAKYEKKVVYLTDDKMQEVKKPLEDFDDATKAKLLKLIKQQPKDTKKK